MNGKFCATVVVDDCCHRRCCLVQEELRHEVETGGDVLRVVSHSPDRRRRRRLRPGQTGGHEVGHQRPRPELLVVQHISVGVARGASRHALRGHRDEGPARPPRVRLVRGVHVRSTVLVLRQDPLHAGARTVGYRPQDEALHVPVIAAAEAFHTPSNVTSAARIRAGALGHHGGEAVLQLVNEKLKSMTVGCCC